MDATVEFSVDGQSVMEYTGELSNYDFNGDGYVNRADAQLLLDHVTCGAALLANEAYADLNGDGQVTTYDVHQFLKLYQGHGGGSRGRFSGGGCVRSPDRQ